LLGDVGLETRMDHFPNQLSGGEQQRVTIARSIANKPKILLLDEPTGDLDTRSTDIVMKILVDLNMKEGITMIMVTHDVALKGFANRVVRMMDGKVHKIITMPSEQRNKMMSDLNDRVEAILSGDDKGALTVREGIQEENNSKTDKTQRKIPDNFKACFDTKNATKTSVRTPKDYPVLRERFAN
jgi:putative ABC transport system ATP-binding protein